MTTVGIIFGIILGFFLLGIVTALRFYVSLTIGVVTTIESLIRGGDPWDGLKIGGIIYLVLTFVAFAWGDGGGGAGGRLTDQVRLNDEHQRREREDRFR
jgi:hypothetical protein